MQVLDVEDDTKSCRNEEEEGVGGERGGGRGGGLGGVEGGVEDEDEGRSEKCDIFMVRLF